MLVDKKQYNDAVKNVIKAVSKDENRPCFMHVHLFTKDNDLYMEATDGFRLHQTKVQVTDAKTDEVPQIDILIKDLKSENTKDKLLKIEITKEFLKVGSSLYSYSTNKKEYTFIDSEQVIPKNYKTEFSIMVNARYLADALKDINTEDKHIVELFFDNKNNNEINSLSPILLKTKNSTSLVLPIRNPNR